MFYTYFDGFLEGAVTRSESLLNRVIYDVRKSLEGIVPAASTQRYLVLLRGSHTKTESLVLTEDDYEDLNEQVAKISPELAATDPGDGRTLLFIGVHPRDPLVRLLKPAPARDRETAETRPAIFVWQ